MALNIPSNTAQREFQRSSQTQKPIPHATNPCTQLPNIQPWRSQGGRRQRRSLKITDKSVITVTSVMMVVMIHVVPVVVVVVVEMIREEVPKVHQSCLDQVSRDYRKAHHNYVVEIPFDHDSRDSKNLCMTT